MKTLLSKSSQGDHISLMSIGFDKSLSKCNSQFDLFSFDDEKRKNIRSDFVEKRSTCIPGILGFPIPARGRSISFISKTSECVFYPLDQSFISVDHMKSYFVARANFSDYFLKVNAAFSIYDSSKVSKLSFIPHDKMITKNRFKVHRKRLNPEGHIVKDNEMIYDSLTSCESTRERSEEVAPPANAKIIGIYFEYTEKLVKMTQI